MNLHHHAIRRQALLRAFCPPCDIRAEQDPAAALAVDDPEFSAGSVIFQTDSGSGSFYSISPRKPMGALS